MSPLAIFINRTITVTLFSAVCCCVINIIKFKLAFSNVLVSDVLYTLGNPALLTMLGSRILFNLKEAAELGVNEGTSVWVASGTLSDIDFSEPENPQRCDFRFLFAAMADCPKRKVHRDRGLLGTVKGFNIEAICSI